MKPWEFLALAGLFLFLALSSYGRARMSAHGSDDRNVSRLLTALLGMFCGITPIAISIKHIS